MQKPVLLFDLDGTLIDSAIGITRCAAYALEQMQIAVPNEAQLRRWIGPPLRDSFAPLFDFDVDKTEQAVVHYRERFEHTGWAEHEIYGGIEHALFALQQAGYRMAVVTAKNEPHAVKIVSNFSFADVFETVVGASIDGRISYKSQLIEIAMQRMNLQASQCVMIGDRHMDIEGAKHHQMASAGVLWGFGSHQELQQAGADLLLERPEQLSSLGAQFSSAPL
jgi:phosphoglycolate phosphatase